MFYKIIFKKKSLFVFQLLGECHCWWTKETQRAHFVKFYSRLRLICSVWRASKFSVFKIEWNCNSVGLLHHPFWLQFVIRHFCDIIFRPFCNYFAWLRITDEGSVPEMRIWSILLINSDLKWCIHLSRSLFLYFNHLKMFLLCFIQTLAHKLISNYKDCQFSNAKRNFNGLKFCRKKKLFM